MNTRIQNTVINENNSETIITKIGNQYRTKPFLSVNTMTDIIYEVYGCSYIVQVSLVGTHKL